MDRCPNCRARWDGGESCRRCGLDLAPLLALEQAAATLLARAIARLARGDTQGALHALAAARTLSAEPLIGHLLGFARRLGGVPPSPR